MLSSLTVVATLLATMWQVQPPADGDRPSSAEISHLNAPADSMVFSGRSRQLNVAIPRHETADVQLDGLLDEAIWGQAAVMRDFTQYEPVEGIPSTEDTEVRVFYTSDAIYFGIRAFDKAPKLILGRMGERDRAVFGDDWVRLMIDTFDDQRQAYVFYVNPLGLQTDGLWIEGMQRRPGSPVSIDFNPDFIWASNGRVTEEGWSAEVKIPYVSLRFREAEVQNWGFNVAREVKRKGFKQAWAPLTQNVSSTLAQSGKLMGLRDLRPKKLIELNPVATGKRTGQIEDEAFQRDGFEPEFSLNARYGLTSNLILDATLNPDFSQVEADANQITVNERFALFFPEKRAFFLEGTEIFRTPRNLVHTRQIVDPSAGTKATGKIGSFNVGYLSALDDSPRSLFEEDYKALFNLLRVRRDVGAGSTVGVLYTDRSTTQGGAYNRVLSGDARFLFKQRYTLTTQFASSWTTTDDGEQLRAKPLATVSLERSGRRFGWLAKVDDVHPDFRTRSGFIPRIGDTEVFGSLQTTRFGEPGSLLERLRTELRVDAFFNHNEFWDGGSPFEWEVELNPTFSFRGDRSVTVILRDGFFRFRPEDYASFEVEGAEGPAPFVVPDKLTHMKAIAFIPRARINNRLQANGRIFLREVPLFIEAARGFEVQLAPELTLRPTTSLQVSLSHTYSRLWRRRDDTIFSTVHISRLQTQYQFSKALFVRTILQYDLEERDALRDPTTGLPLLISGTLAGPRDEGRFEAQFLVSYEPSPGTIFFIGYNRVEEGDRTFRFTRMDPIEDGFFVKLSYLFRI